MRNGSVFPAVITLTPGSKALIQLEGTTIGSDGSAFWRSSGPLLDGDSDLVETLLYDRIDHLLIAAASGAAVRSPGSRVRYAPRGMLSSPAIYYEIYALSEIAPKEDGASRMTRVYCVNSDTGQLERVDYGMLRNGAEVNVETTLTGWQSISGELLPTQIVRSENGTPVLTINISSTAFAPLSAAPSFVQP